LGGAAHDPALHVSARLSSALLISAPHVSAPSPGAASLKRAARYLAQHRTVTKVREQIAQYIPT